MSGSVTDSRDTVINETKALVSKRRQMMKKQKKKKVNMNYETSKKKVLLYVRE